MKMTRKARVAGFMVGVSGDEYWVVDWNWLSVRLLGVLGR